MTDNGFIDAHINIAADIKKNGCPVCNHIGNQVLYFFADWIHDLSTSEALQKENANAHGLCPFHSWQLVAIGSPLGISNGYVRLIRQIADELLNASETTEKAAMTLHSLVNNAGNCRICALMRREESVYLSKLSAFLKHTTIGDSNTSVRLCLKHLKIVAMEIKDIEMIRFLMKKTAKHLTAIADEMDNYREKRLNLQNHLLTKSEKMAYFRGITYTVGGRHICNQFD